MNITEIISLVLGVASLTIPFIVPKEYRKYAAIGTLLFVVLMGLVYFSVVVPYFVLYVLLGISVVLNFFLYRRQIFMQRLITFFKEKEQKEEYAQIIRWGHALSKPLWLSHNLEHRVKIGKIVEIAATKFGNNKMLARVLIDDIGWTSVELQKNDAEEQIQKGISVAEQENYYYMIAKGYRHLCGLYLRLGNQLCTAEDFLKKSKENIDKMTESRHKKEMDAEHDFANALLELYKGEHGKAETAIMDAEKKYVALTDEEWKIKIAARKGDIFLASQKNNKIETAINIFNEGREESYKFQYFQQEVKNLTGLGACYIAKQQYDEARKNLKKAKKIATKLSLRYDMKIIEEHIDKLKQ